MCSQRGLIAAASALALLGCSSPEAAADITLSNGWTREIAPGQTAAAVYMSITNKGAGSDRLTVVQSAQGEASLHTTSSSDGVARMRPLEGGLPIAQGSTVELKPGATHIMLTGLKQRPRRGETIELTLGFQRSGKRPMTIRVVGAADDVHSSHRMSM
jgi:hypothetical protein